ncbi:hypothetical protein [Dactylosporangium sp. CA-139066]|uniref:hypothetical protein n=1 Tax=Dactylosporangium sp. CA-139066 TaxID=3239930 RepID=UPI003D9465F8
MQPEGDEMAPQVDDDAPAATDLDGGAVSASAPAPSPDSGVATPGVGAPAPSSGSTAPSSGAASVNGAAYRSAGGSTAALLAGLWNESDRQRIRGRWQELQLRFIDDPHLVAGEAERLVQEAVASLTASLDQRRGQLHQQRAARGLDTENLRASLRDYREFLDRILGL